MPLFQKAIKSIAIQTAALALFFLLYHKFLHYAMREASINLGAVKFNSHFVPLYAEPRLELSWWLLPALFVCGGFLYLCYRYFINRAWEPVRIIAIAILCFTAIHITVAQIDGYNELPEEQGQILAFLEPYTRTSLEYYGDVPRLNEMGLRAFLRDYSHPELFNTLSGHTRTHPPGGVVFLWGVSKLFGYNLLSASLASVLFTALTVIPIYRLSTHLYDEKIARYALVLFLITPNFVMFTGTSMDGPFSVFPIFSVYLFYEALSRFSSAEVQLSRFHKAHLYSLLTGLSLAFGMFMSYSTVVIGIFLSVLPLLSLYCSREHTSFRTHVKVLLFAGIAFIGFYLLLFLLTGFRPVEALWAAIKKDEAGMGTGYETVERYFHLSFANLFAFLIGVGIPITTVWIRQLVRTLRSAIRHRRIDATPDTNFVIGYLITLLFFTFSTLFTMEVERIWMFMVPFLIIPAAKYLTEQPRSDFYAVSAMLAVQLILSEVFLYTYW